MAKPGEHYDLVVLSELADITAWSEYAHGKVVYDLINSYLAIPRTNIKQLLRGPRGTLAGGTGGCALIFRGAIQAMCARADAVVCTTDRQRDEILPFCPNVHVVLDIQDDAIVSIKRDYRAGEVINLIWEGLPSNIPQVATIRPVLRELSKRRRIELTLVTDLQRPRLFGRFGRIDSAKVARGIFDDVRIEPWDKRTLFEPYYQKRFVHYSAGSRGSVCRRQARKQTLPVMAHGDAGRGLGDESLCAGDERGWPELVGVQG